MNNLFSLVIPTYNESKNIQGLCLCLLKVLSGQNFNFEIIVVDDDSPDGTWKIVQELAEKEKVFKVIRRLGKRGLGSAVIDGWHQAQGNILGVIDGDLQHPPEAVPSMVKKIISDGGIDIVVASRHVQGGGVSKWSLLRRLISWLGALTSAFFLPEILAKVRDPMSGYFILRREVIQGKSLTPIGYKILLEVLAKGNYRGIIEFPYFFQERQKGGSKAGLRQYIISLAHMIRLSIQIGEIFRVIKYMAVGLVGAAVTLGGYLYCIHLNISQAFSFFFAIELAILNNFLLNEFWTFSDKASIEAALKYRITRFIKFNLICFYGALFSFLTFLFFLKFVKLLAVQAAIMGTGVGFIWNFIASTNIVWLSGISKRKFTNEIDEGYYFKVLENNKIQHFWHNKKFEIASKKLSAAPVVDIGSGPGIFLYYYGKFPGLKVNLDCSYRQLAYGKNLNPGAYYINSSVSDLPFASGSLGTVYFLETIEHLKPEEIRRTMSEIFRVLRPGGKAIISTPNYRSIWPFFEFIISLLGPVDYRLQHISHLDMNKLVNYVNVSGLNIVNKETFFIFSPFFSVVSERISNILLNLERKILPKAGTIMMVETVKE